ncbi:methyl-accepting chemotaxis protein [Paenibacillus sp. YN15]|uniref:methyl-accepting chemotaxis protein n=1 Tax=Paenibacillus sp. YN15 TaxID=1742774 RepID=UPI000DCE8759|nr:methyl-accepting chemotaxis protein [Paenibacillus sp. YN15]RAU97673.1 methyl-accepting chemotaxis protein [Paenibacillus sp. YN15]
MMWFANMKTGTKLISSFSVLAVIVAVVGLFGLMNLSKINESLDDMYMNQLMAVQSLEQIDGAIQEARHELRKIYMVTEKERAGVRDGALKLLDDADKGLQRFRQTELSAASADELPVLEKALAEYRTIYLKAAQEGLDNNLERMLEMIDGGEIGTVRTRMLDSLDRLRQINNNEAQHARNDGVELYTDSRNLTIGVIIGAVFLSGLLGLIISRAISNPLKKVMVIVGDVAGGDLRRTSDIQSKDEIGQLAQAVDSMVLSLRGIVAAILANAQNVAASAQQISASSEEIAGGSANQAEAAQSISELFKELSAAIHSVAANTEQTSELAEESIRLAMEGRDVIQSSMTSMEAVSTQMAKLEDDSHKIGEILDVIEDIADQTNLLALNAAIEAARAGDQGRGFAVVADEVRKLAERSREATKQITGIIRVMQDNTRQSVATVQESGNFSKQSGNSFHHISKMVNDAGAKISEIAAASEEQAAQSANVLHAVENISAATEEGAAASQEMAATAQSLSLLADELQKAVIWFKMPAA